MSVGQVPMRPLDRIDVDLVAVTPGGVGLALHAGPPPRFILVAGCRASDVRVAAHVTDAGTLLVSATRADAAEDDEDDEEEG